MALSARAVKAWDIAHTWSSIACTLFLLILCVTGLPLIFADELEGHAPFVQTPEGEALPLSHIVAEARAKEPSAFVQFVFWDDDPSLIGVGLAGRAEGGLEDVRRVLFNRFSGARVEERPPPSGILQTIRDLHTNLLIGTAGEFILVAVALLFLASIVSGIVLYAPFLGTRPFGAIRQSAPRPRWLDLHNLIGIAAAAWLCVVGATGLMNALEAPLFAAWDSQTMPALLVPYHGKPIPKHLADLDAAVATAKAAAPGMTPTSVGFPTSPFGSPRHYLIWLKGNTRLTSHFFTPVLVDAADGHLTAARPLPWYLRLLEICRPLHFGDYGGLPLKIIWAVFDLGAIAILLSGIYLWLGRRRRRLGA